MVKKQELKEIVNERMELPSGVQFPSHGTGRIDTRDGETFRSTMARLTNPNVPEMKPAICGQLQEKEKTKEGAWNIFSRTRPAGRIDEKQRQRGTSFTDSILA